MAACWPQLGEKPALRQVRSLWLVCAALIIATVSHPQALMAADDTPPPVRPGDKPFPGIPASSPTSDLIQPPWADFSIRDFVLTGGGLAGLVAGSIIKPGNGIVTTNPFDEAVRNAIGFNARNSRIPARDVSDLLLSVALVFPVAVDGLVFTAFVHHDRALAGQLALVDAEAFLIAGAIQQLTASLTGRQRPYTRNCANGTLPPNTTDCQAYNGNRSFFSGHTTLAFTAAALTCVHHMQLPLYGGVADPIACAAGMVVAATTGVLRVVGDQHYATDVLAGAFVGLAVGFSVPLLIRPKRPLRINGIDLALVPTGLGAAIRGDY